MFVPFNPFDGYVVTTNFGVALASNVRLLSPPVKLYVDSYVPLAAKAVNTEENKTTAKKLKANIFLNISKRPFTENL
ncbi:hypothetical protein GsuE55_01690 [Geobacillus subterraneus]|uniref:Uncharacterized protein n=1 Tax=Geobacillus subterraneus TaxID=129338 RepID=A0A679FND4_9BACL|nr:hypothetical protein GsuE55_01690 [Geobacillus subterraneus]